MNKFITSITAATVSVIFVAAPAAQAAKNDGRFATSSESMYKKTEICSELKQSYDFNMSYYKGNPSKRGRWKNTAENLKTLAGGNDCSWAQ